MVSENDVRRLFLQAVMSRGVLSGKLAKTLWIKCIDAVQAANDHLDLPQVRDETAWNAFVVQVNASLDPLDLEFRHLNDESDGKVVYTIVNGNGDGVAQMATEYSPVEIAYFKAIVEQIMLAPKECYSVSSLAALREVNAVKSTGNMSKSQAEVVLGSFVAKGWLLKSQRGRYSLSARALLELSHYLRKEYKDEANECTICMELVTRGVACNTANCQCRLHWHCFKAYRRRHVTCPACIKPWPEEARPPLLPVGEAAIKDGAEDQRRRVRKETAEDSEEEEAQEPEQDELEDDDNDDPSQATQKQTQTQPKAEVHRGRSRRGKK